MIKQIGFAPVILIIAVVTLLAAVILGIILFSNKTPIPTVTPVPTPALTTTLTPTLTPQAVSPIPTITTTPSPTKSYPGTTQYISPNLKIAFNYLPNQGGQKVAVKEVGNKIYIYADNTSFDNGQFVEVLSKDKNDTLAEAIEKKFLNGISKNDCFVISENNNFKFYPASYSTAEISYPENNDPNTGPGEIPAKCPQNYSRTNGIRYFLGDSNHPEKLLFISIGQYGISAGESINWQDTISFPD